MHESVKSFRVVGLGGGQDCEPATRMQSWIGTVLGTSVGLSIVDVVSQQSGVLKVGI